MMVKTALRVAFVVLAIGACLPLQARDTIGLVLAGGGARGIAHAGVIKALEELQVPVDAVAGTSMGALVGGLYASGQDSDELYRVIQSIDWEKAFEDSVPRDDLPQRRKSDDYDYATDFTLNFEEDGLAVPLGLIQGQQVRQMIKELMQNVSHIRDFDKLPTPYRAVATDIENGDAYIFEGGNIVTAMRASMSLPALLAPVEHDGRLLVDGGLAMNIPVDVGHDMGVDKIIVVDIGTPLKSREEITSLLGVTDQMFGFLTRKNSVEQLERMNEQDILIRPELESRGMLDFELAEEIFQLGYEATIAQAAQLKKYAVDDSAWQAYLAQRSAPFHFESNIDFIAIDNNSRVGDELIRARLHQPLGEPLDRDLLQRDIATIYALDYWEIIDYELIRDERGDGLKINAYTQSAADHKLKLGLNLSTDLDGASNLNAGGSYLHKGINRLGGEVYARVQFGEQSLLSAEFFQPTDILSRFFVVPHVSYLDRKVNTLGPEFDVTRLIGSWRVREARLDLGGGANVGANGQARIGLFRSVGEFEVGSTSSELLPDGDFDKGGAYVSLRYDTLDDPFFATRGLFLFGDYQWHREDMGADNEYDRLEFIGQGAVSFGDNDANNLKFTARTVIADDATKSPQNFTTLGGLFNLSGFSQDLLSGRQMAFLMAQYQRKLTRTGVLPINVPVYAGLSVEGGNLWQERDDMDFGDMIMAGSVYLAVNSPLGPIYLAYGRNEEELDALYVSIGWPFLQPTGRLAR